MKQLVKFLLSRTPYRLYKNIWPNRFDAMMNTLGVLSKSQPDIDVIVDVGANTGQFHQLAFSIFPSVQHHLIEPQPACESALNEIASRRQNVTYHQFGLSNISGKVPMVVPANGGASTGASLVTQPNKSLHTVDVEVTTLNHFATKHLEKVKRGLIKIDVEGHEWNVIQGQAEPLQQFQYIICESRFHLKTGSVSDIISWMNDNGFKLIDMASISGNRQTGKSIMCDLVFERKE